MYNYNNYIYIKKIITKVTTSSISELVGMIE